jgi:hypothetical protein
MFRFMYFTLQDHFIKINRNMENHPGKQYNHKN